MRYDLILRDATIVLPDGEARTEIGVRGGRIAAIGLGAGDEAETVLSLPGLHVLPGIVDPHVHFRDPGDPAIESIATGSRAAVLGGVTTVFDMPNTSPAATSSEALAAKRAHAEAVSWCDIGLYVGATRENIPDLASLEAEPAICAIKVFMGSSTGNLLIEDDESIERLMRAGRRRVAFHSEDEYRLRERRALFQLGDPYDNHRIWRDEECAFLGTRRLVTMARLTGRPIHILHVSTAEEFAYLRDNRDVATAEILATHLTLTAPECHERLGGLAVMNPPIRDKRHLEAGWAAVRDGTIETIGSDHAPHTVEAKQRPWPSCAAGLPAVQTNLPIMLDHVAAGRLSILRLAQLMSTNPARLYGAVCKGAIAAGYDADFSIVDLKRERVIEESGLAYPVGWSPFTGMRVTGWPVATIVRGRVVMRDGEVLGAPSGRLVRFN